MIWYPRSMQHGTVPRAASPRQIAWKLMPSLSQSTLRYDVPTSTVRSKIAHPTALPAHELLQLAPEVESDFSAERRLAGAERGADGMGRPGGAGEWRSGGVASEQGFERVRLQSTSVAADMAAPVLGSSCSYCTLKTCWRGGRGVPSCYVGDGRVGHAH